MQHHVNAGRVIEVPERIRFRDIDPAGVPECCSLKIIVTDITQQKLVVFDGSPPYRDVEVAEVAAASTAIPFVFKPARIPSYQAAPNSLYADGGLVSNLPIWVFAEEKLDFERTQLPNSRVPILAFSLIEGGGAPDAGGGGGAFAYVGAVARSAVETTQFDFSTRNALDAYYEAYAEAARILGRETRVLPAQVRGILQNFHNRILDIIRQRQRHPQPAVERFRVSLIRPFGHSSFRIVESLNMEDDADDRLVFSNLTDGAPDAFRNRRPAFLDFAPMWARGTNPNMTKYEFALLRRQTQYAICLPVFADPEAWAVTPPALRPIPLGVVSIDSDTSLAHIFNDRQLLTSLAAESLVLSTVFPR